MNEMYLDDSYLWSFNAMVTQALENKAILNKTAFYPQSGGQPSDTGILEHGSEIFQVTGTEKAEDGIVHILDRPGLKPGDKVSGKIDGD